MGFSSSVVFPEFLMRPITADLHLHSDLSNYLDMFRFTAAAAFQSVYQSDFWAHYGAGRFGTSQQLRDRVLNALTGCTNTQHHNLFTCTLGIEVPQGSVLGPRHIRSYSVVQTDMCLLLERYQTLTAPFHRKDTKHVKRSRFTLACIFTVEQVRDTAMSKSTFRGGCEQQNRAGWRKKL